jgi:hypothetical protein
MQAKMRKNITGVENSEIRGSDKEENYKMLIIAKDKTISDLKATLEV